MSRLRMLRGPMDARSDNRGDAAQGGGEPATTNALGHGSASRGSWLPGFIAGAAMLLALRARLAFLVDDSFISFRYARNWWETGTPVFNSFELAEGGQPVEGFSNALWTGALALAHGAGLDLVTAAPWLQLACALAALLVVARAAANLGLGVLGRMGAPLLLGTAAPFVAWSQGGMETTLFTALLAVLFAGLVNGGAHRRHQLAAALGAAGVVWVRVEGFAWVLGTVAAVAVAARLAGRDARLPRRLSLTAAGAAALALLLQLAWRRAVYGEWLPNTVAAKTGVERDVLLSRGLHYVGSWAVVTLTPILAALAVVPAWTHRLPGARRAALAGAGMLLGGVGYCLAVGGDWMPFFRFLAPITPALALLAAIGIDRLPRIPGGLLLAVGAALQPLALFDLHVAPAGLRESLRFRGFEGGYKTEAERIEAARRNLDYFAPLGELLARGTEPGDVLAFGAIGSVGWYAPELDLLDRNGLVTPEVTRASAEEASTAVATAGHDKRVPHAWFLERGTPQARYLFASWLDGATGPATPELTRFLTTRLRQNPKLRGPEEAALWTSTTTKVVPVSELDRTLVLLERR